MTKDNFDTLSEKLLNKLDEDYSLLNEEEDGFSGNMGSTDPKESLIKTLEQKKKQSEAESQEVYDKYKKSPEEIKPMMHHKHKKSVYDRINAEQKVRAIKLTEDIEDYSDDEYFYMAEEFENDLNSTREKVLDNQIDQLQNKIDNKSDEIKKAQNTNKEVIDNNKSINKEEREQEINNIDKIQKQETEKIQKDCQSQVNTLTNQKNQLEQKLEKTKQVKNFVGGNNMDLKEEIMKQHTLAESIKERIEDHKLEKAVAARNKVNSKIEKINDKINKLSFKLKKADWKHNIDKCEKIQRKIEQLNLDKEHLVRDFKNYDDKVATGEFNQSIRENLNYKIDFDSLYEAIDQLEKQVDETEKECDEIKPQEKDLYGCEDIVNKSYNSPLLAQLAEKIKEEINKDKVDEAKVKQLKLKFKQLQSQENR